MRSPADQFRADLARLARSARLRAAVRRVLPALAAGFAAGLLFALLRPLLPGPLRSWSPIVVTLSAAAAAALAGCLLGALARIDRRAILIAVDRALGTRELAGTTLDLLSGSRRSAFAEAIVSQAAEALRRAAPRAVFGRMRLRLLPVVALVAAAAIAASLLPFDLAGLFPRRAPRVYDLAFVGDELGEAGRRLREAAQGSDQRRDLEIALALRELSSEIVAGQVPPDELADRLALMERDLAAELQARIRRAQAQQAPRGSGGRPGTKDGATTENAEAGEPGPQGPDSETSSAAEEEQAPADRDALAGALDTLQRMRGSDTAGTGEEAERGGSRGQRPGGPRGGPGEPSGGGNESPDSANPKGAGAPGSMPQKDTRDPGSRIASPRTSEPLGADAEVGEGSMARMLVRALPDSVAPRASEDETLRQYQRQAESALSAEEVPYELRGYVRDYFLGVGVIGR